MPNMLITFQSDNIYTRGGFNISYEIVSKDNVCASNEECHSGYCDNGICRCSGSNYGDLCEFYLSDMKPRERHAVAYDSARDLAFISYGLGWQTDRVHTDFFYYNFSTEC